LKVRVEPAVPDALNPPFLSITTPELEDGTTVKGRLFGSVFPSSRPGDGIFRYVAVFAV
jgi:hypothetical protein